MSERGVSELTVGEMAEETGVSVHTLRYYERAGLIRPVARTSGNQRRYYAQDVAWLEFLLKLRATGMPIRQMRVYAELREAGPTTVPARLNMLVEHRRSLRERIGELQRHDEILELKIDAYRHMLVDEDLSID